MVRSFSLRDGLFAAVDCSDWEDFRRTARDMLKSHAGSNAISDKFAFRGQSCSTWLLEPSFDRTHSGLSPADRDEHYTDQMRLFRENYSVYGEIARNPFSDTLSDFQALDDAKVEAIAQHYGLSTRLLDWSFSMYVAAFFAFSRVDLCISGQVSIWSIDLSILDKFSKKEISSSRDVYKGNVRNLWQMGIFLRNHTSNPNLASLFLRASRSYDHKLDGGNPALIRFDFPVSCETDVLDDLQMMRINSMTIFPGMEGVINWIKRKTSSV